MPGIRYGKLRIRGKQGILGRSRGEIGESREKTEEIGSGNSMDTVQKFWNFWAKDWREIGGKIGAGQRGKIRETIGGLVFWEGFSLGIWGFLRWAGR